VVSSGEGRITISPSRRIWATSTSECRSGDEVPAIARHENAASDKGRFRLRGSWDDTPEALGNVRGTASFGNEKQASHARVGISASSRESSGIEPLSSSAATRLACHEHCVDGVTFKSVVSCTCHQRSADRSPSVPQQISTEAARMLLKRVGHRGHAIAQAEKWRTRRPGGEGRRLGAKCAHELRFPRSFQQLRRARSKREQVTSLALMPPKVVDQRPNDLVPRRGPNTPPRSIVLSASARETAPVEMTAVTPRKSRTLRQVADALTTLLLRRARRFVGIRGRCPLASGAVPSGEDRDTVRAWREQVVSEAELSAQPLSRALPVMNASGPMSIGSPAARQSRACLRARQQIRTA